MARSDAAQLKSDAGGFERLLSTDRGSLFTQLPAAGVKKLWDHTPHARQ